MSDSVRPQRRQPTRLPRPWDSPGKNTGVGRHFLLQCVKVNSEIAQLCPTLSDPMDYSPPGPSVHGIVPARVLEWGTIAFSLVLISLLKFLTQLIIFLLFIKMQSTTIAVNETRNLSSLSTNSTHPLVHRFHCYLPVHTRGPTFIEDQLLFE